MKQKAKTKSDPYHERVLESLSFLAGSKTTKVGVLKLEVHCILAKHTMIKMPYRLGKWEWLCKDCNRGYWYE